MKNAEFVKVLEILTLLVYAMQYSIKYLNANNKIIATVNRFDRYAPVLLTPSTSHQPDDGMRKVCGYRCSAVL